MANNITNNLTRYLEKGNKWISAYPDNKVHEANIRFELM